MSSFSKKTLIFFMRNCFILEFNYYELRIKPYQH